jgi:hypothetical protein
MSTVQKADGGVDAFVYSVRADTRAWCPALVSDLLPLLASLTCAALAFAADRALLGTALILLATAVIAVQTVALAVAGRTLGAWVFGIRVVERSSGCPSGRLLAADVVAGRLGAFDIRRGRDPITPAVAAYRFPEPTVSSRAPIRATNAVALLDSGQRLPFARALVVGRNPTVDARGDQRFSWPDLSRTLSKTHARLEWDGESVWITDLGSANGTTLEIGVERATLDPFVPTRMRADAVLWLGDRSLTIAGSRRDRRAALEESDLRDASLPEVHRA